ncbi:hypothetical protein [Chryseobacterium camelliae]|uniref:hypothetical protein n=1 Tax=Chryseobacterium camelliae TaxID=1265445 RepID=UPI000C1C8572|nr:hypothetical protein [Chryseobacterium camelliae]
MPSIKNIEGLTTDQVNQELAKGAKFIMFSYTISIIILTTRKRSDIYFIRAGESTASYSWKYSMINFLFGWWGFPFGPIFTIGAFYTNFTGGKDVTQDVLNHVNFQ